MSRPQWETSCATSLELSVLILSDAEVVLEIWGTKEQIQPLFLQGASIVFDEEDKCTGNH